MRDRRSLVLGAVLLLALLGFGGYFALSSSLRPATLQAKAVGTAHTASPVGAAATTPRARPLDTPILSAGQFQAGATVFVYGNDASLPDKITRLLDRLEALHLNSVGMAFPIFQGSWTASAVTTDAAATPDAAYISFFVREAHRRHMAVLLRPLLDEQNIFPSGHWRGTIQPSNRAAWFASYQALATQIGSTAQAAGADVFDIGTELGSMQTDTQHWLQVISAVRQVYRGQVTYSSNWDAPYPAFGNALDFVSVDGFFPLSAPEGATISQLVHAWGAWVGKLLGIRNAAGKPIVMTELGTTSETGSYQAPYTWQHNTGVNLDDQRRYYAASCQALKPLLSGMYWWAFDLQTPASPAADTSYTPMGKPAEQEIARCFG